MRVCYHFRSASRGRQVAEVKPTASPAAIVPKLGSRDLEFTQDVCSAVSSDLILDFLPSLRVLSPARSTAGYVDNRPAPLAADKSIALSRLEPVQRAARHCSISQRTDPADLFWSAAWPLRGNRVVHILISVRPRRSGRRRQRPGHRPCTLLRCCCVNGAH